MRSIRSESTLNVEDCSVSALIVKDLSRLGREYSCMGRLQDFIFPAYNVRFIAINDDVDSAKGKMILLCSKCVYRLLRQEHKQENPGCCKNAWRGRRTPCRQSPQDISKTRRIKNSGCRRRSGKSSAHIFDL